MARKPALPLACLLAAILCLAATSAYALPTNPDPCHTAMCTPWPNPLPMGFNPAADGHQHRNGDNLWDMVGAYKTYSVWDDAVYQYDAAGDQPFRQPGSAKDFGHGFMNHPATYFFDITVPAWAKIEVVQAVNQWEAEVNELAANSNGIPTVTKIQFRLGMAAGNILVRFAPSYPVGPMGGTVDQPFPDEHEIASDGNRIGGPPAIPGGAPKGGRSGVLAFWTPSIRVLTFNSKINWYQSTGNPAMDNNGAFGANQFDFYSTALHEWGHVLGLDHPTNPNAGTTMYPTLPHRNFPAGIVRTIDPGSENGAKNLYTIARCPDPAAGPGECPLPEPCDSCCPVCDPYEPPPPCEEEEVLP